MAVGIEGSTTIIVLKDEWTRLAKCDPLGSFPSYPELS